MQIFLTLLLSSLICFQVLAQNSPDYKNPNLPIENRVQDLMGRMTLEEKFWQMFMIPGDLSIGKEKLKTGIFGFQVSAQSATGDAAGHMLVYNSGGSAKQTALKINEIQKFFLEESRLGIPIIPFDESLHGLIRKNATAFPQSIALAATFDPKLMRQVAHAIALETKSRGIRQILSPVINIARDVRWGRTEETYGEDTYLTSQMGLSYMLELEKLDVISTPKHFAVNVGDGGRDSYPIYLSERLLDEVYFPAFKLAFQKAGARSVMTSYNSLNGSPCSANNWLLNQKLKKEWGFKGFVISDACAVGGANVLHYTTGSYAESAAASIKNGLDVIFQTDYAHAPLFYEAFEKGMIPIAVIDSAVARVLRVKFQLGLFENPYIDAELADKINGCKEHREIALDASRESIVLLKNSNKILPLSSRYKNIAVLGNEAVAARLGGYSGDGNDKISILEGIRAEVDSNVKVKFSEGCSLHELNFITVHSSYMCSNLNGVEIEGLKAEYFNNIELLGEPKISRIDKQIDFNWTLYGPDPSLPNDWYSVRWSGYIVPDSSGTFNIGIEGNDGYRLYLNDELLIDNWIKKSFSTQLKQYTFIKGKKYSIRVEYFETVGNARFRLVWNAGLLNNSLKKIENAMDLTNQSDVAIVCVGIHEGEFQDRASLALPGKQEDLIRAICKIGKPVIVVLVGGSAITMNNWINQVDGIIDVWYPGEMGGKAIAEVLFGKYNPAGRLPITFPIDEGQLPLHYNHKPTGRGDDYADLTGQPLFPFGYGLSYTDFKYEDLRFDKESISCLDSVKVSFVVTNTGPMSGDEVCQLYIRDEIASIVRPVQELKHFERISLLPNESKTVSFHITPSDLGFIDLNDQFVVEPGVFRLMIGSSSRDIRLRGVVKVD